jgi:hypothetical protein
MDARIKISLRECRKELGMGKRDERVNKYQPQQKYWYEVDEETDK